MLWRVFAMGVLDTGMMMMTGPMMMMFSFAEYGYPLKGIKAVRQRGESCD